MSNCLRKAPRQRALNTFSLALLCAGRRTPRVAKPGISRHGTAWHRPPWAARAGLALVAVTGLFLTVDEVLGQKELNCPVGVGK